MKRRALIVLDGVMRGSFTVGALRVFHEKLESNFFDTTYSFSVGVFEQVFFAANQVETMEYVWRECVHGSKLINIFNIFKGKEILDLDYLINLFQIEKTSLIFNNLLKSHMDAYCFATDSDTRLLKIFDLKKENIFDVMRASCAVPFLHGSVKINGKGYIDGALASKKDIEENFNKICDKFDEVVVIDNGSNVMSLPNNLKIRLLRPSYVPLWHSLDTNRRRIIRMIEQGKSDARIFLQKYIEN